MARADFARDAHLDWNRHIHTNLTARRGQEDALRIAEHSCRGENGDHRQGSDNPRVGSNTEGQAR